MRLDYSKRITPRGYLCVMCGVSGCKLWRMNNRKELMFCGACAITHQRRTQLIHLEENGDHAIVGLNHHRDATFNTGMWTDQIGWLVPAVPREDGPGYWLYLEIPEAARVWWRNLPLRITRESLFRMWLERASERTRTRVPRPNYYSVLRVDL